MLAYAGSVGLFRKKTRDRSLDPEQRSPELGIKIKDLLVLEQMVQAGADLTQPRHVLHYLYFPSREAAEAAVAEVPAPFGAEIGEPSPERSEQWAVRCEAHEYTLTADVVRENTDQFEALAQANGGDYDGWEASIS